MPKGSWIRPPGCECSETEARRDRCDGKWTRCNARIAFTREQKLAELGGVPRETHTKGVAHK